MAEYEQDSKSFFEKIKDRLGIGNKKLLPGEVEDKKVVTNRSVFAMQSMGGFRASINSIGDRISEAIKNVVSPKKEVINQTGLINNSQIKDSNDPSKDTQDRANDNVLDQKSTDTYANQYAQNNTIIIAGTKPVSQILDDSLRVATIQTDKSVEELATVTEKENDDLLQGIEELDAELPNSPTQDSISKVDLTLNNISTNEPTNDKHKDVEIDQR